MSDHQNKMQSIYQSELKNKKESKKLAQQIANWIKDEIAKSSIYLYLSGNLGAGKTTFTRYLLHFLGYQGLVKSPTYSLIESYKINQIEVFHLDLYRLVNFDELEFLDYKNCFEGRNLVVIEWPEKFLEHLPQPNLLLELNFAESTLKSTKLFTKRKLKIIAPQNLIDLLK